MAQQVKQKKKKAKKGKKGGDEQWQNVGASVAGKDDGGPVVQHGAQGEIQMLDEYPVNPPHCHVRIYTDPYLTKIYEVLEPELTEKEQAAYEQIKDTFVRALDVGIEDLGDESPEDYIRRGMDKIIKGYGISLKGPAKEKVLYYLTAQLQGYGKMDVLMRDPNIEDISCDGVGVPLYVVHRKYESVETTLIWDDPIDLEYYVTELAQRSGKHISVAEPLVDATMNDGSRIVLKLGYECSTRGSAFCIHKFKEDPFTPTDVIGFRTQSSLMVAYNWLAIQHGMSMLFVGGTASGKTTTLNALALFIPWQMKIVSIEETREINIPHPNWLPGCTRQGFGGEGGTDGEVDMYDLLKAALRERPEYIIVGEIRGPEAYVVFQAMATGVTSYSTVHADSVPALIHRLENKPIEIPRVLFPSLDACSIQMQTRVGGKRVRRTKQIVELIGIDPHTQEVLTNEVFKWSPATDDFEFAGKSYVLEKIMVQTNMSQEGIRDELKQRKRILDWMVLNGIRAREQVAQVITEYYTRPVDLLRRVEG